MRRLVGFFAVVLVIVGGAGSACSSGGGARAETSVSSAAGGATKSASPAFSTTVASARCHTSELSASLGTSSRGAGQIYTPLILRNIGSRPCTLLGYPGVSLLDAAGAQIAQPADRESGSNPASVSVHPGGDASSAVHTVNSEIAPNSCQPASTQVRVVPPGELTPLVFPGVLRICSKTFSVRALVPGPSGTAA